MFDRIAIVAPGLLGASLAIAAHQRSLSSHIGIYARRQEAVDALNPKPWCQTASTDLAEICADADLIVLCAPVDRIISLADELAPIVTRNPIVTDVGSVKLDIVQACQNTLDGRARFIGSHPMAGSEKTGMENAQGDLFDDRICFVTPTESSDPEALTQTNAFWQAIGSRVIETAPQEHDAIVAQVSHLPHVLASTLASFLHDTCPNAKDYCGNGLRDTTRIASGCPGLWSEIVGQNRDEILTAISQFENQLAAVRQAIAQKDDAALQRFLENGKLFRDSL